MAVARLSVVVTLRGPRQFAGQVRERHHTLRARLQILELNVALGQLVADDDGEVGMFFGGGLQLAGQLALCQLGSDGKPLGS